MLNVTIMGIFGRHLIPIIMKKIIILFLAILATGTFSCTKENSVAPSSKKTINSGVALKRDTITGRLVQPTFTAKRDTITGR